MEMLYILNPENFDGSILNTMPIVDVNTKHGKHLLDHTLVHYSGGTFEEYNKKNGGNLIAITWDEFNDKFYAPHLKELQQPFEEITEERYYDLLECVPPKKWHNLNDNLNVFFVGECYTANIYRCCIKEKSTGKFYSAYRAINTTDEQLINDFKIIHFDN